MKPLSDISQTLRIIFSHLHKKNTVEIFVGRDNIGQLSVSPWWLGGWHHMWTAPNFKYGTVEDGRKNSMYALSKGHRPIADLRWRKKNILISSAPLNLVNMVASPNLGKVYSLNPLKTMVFLKQPLSKPVGLLNIPSVQCDANNKWCWRTGQL